MLKLAAELECAILTAVGDQRPPSEMSESELRTVEEARSDVMPEDDPDAGS
jgi:hypothetical protein